MFPLIPPSLLPTQTDGEESDKCSHTALKNGHTIPINCSGIVNLVHLEDEPGKRLSLKKAVPFEEPKKFQGEGRLVVGGMAVV